MSRFSPVLMVVIFSMVALIRRMHSLRLSTPHMRRVGATSTSFSSSSAPNKHKAQAWRVSTSRFLSSNAPISSTVLPGHLYIVATPIGNLEDITIRALKVLQQADVVCAEDTRHTTSLLRHHNLPFKKLVSHHEHSNNIKDILELLKSGQSVALVSDAGTPGVNDPGSSVVTACHQSCIPVHPIPGILLSLLIHTCMHTACTYILMNVYKLHIQDLRRWRLLYLCLEWDRCTPSLASCPLKVQSESNGSSIYPHFDML